MDWKRRIARAVIVMTVALGAGHFVQSMTPDETNGVASEKPARPVDVMPLSAGPDRMKPSAPLTAAAAPAFAIPPHVSPSASAEPAAAQPDPQTSALQESTALDCEITLDLAPQADAMIGIALSAPCNAGEAVVLGHEALRISARTSETGGLITSLPALVGQGEVDVRFQSGAVVHSPITIPDAMDRRRFVVQWQGSKGELALKATGIRAERRLPMDVGQLEVLGDDTVDAPLLAQVYTWPSTADAEVDLVVEASVTRANCARDILGETIDTLGRGAVDLTLTMPGCDAVGDYLLLKIPTQSPKLAAAN